MEQILWLYALPYDSRYPVVCFDERPCFLIGDLVEPRSLQSGQVRQEHFAYTKYGLCALLAAVEPLTGQRLAQVHGCRTQYEYMRFFQALAAAYPEATWLNMTEIEFSALARKCLKRRISTQARLEKEVLSLVEERHARRITLTWQFSIQTASSKLNSHCQQVHSHNSKHQGT